MQKEIKESYPVKKILHFTSLIRNIDCEISLIYWRIAKMTMNTLLAVKFICFRSSVTSQVYSKHLLLLKSILVRMGQYIISGRRKAQEKVRKKCQGQGKVGKFDSTKFEISVQFKEWCWCFFFMFFNFNHDSVVDNNLLTVLSVSKMSLKTRRHFGGTDFNVNKSRDKSRDKIFCEPQLVQR